MYNWSEKQNIQSKIIIFSISRLQPASPKVR